MAARSPGRVLRWALRAPTILYERRMGWVLGHRFLMLTHRGRRTGRLHRTVLEVLNWDPETHEAVVMSGFGPQSHWYQNILSGGASEVAIAGERWQPELIRLPFDEAASFVADYERRNRLVMPIVRRVLSRLAGFRYDGSNAARRRLVATLPLIALRPASHGPRRDSRHSRGVEIDTARAAASRGCAPGSGRSRRRRGRAASPRHGWRCR
jgi:deazaflavin-dependent oxidoreductase (nitroreductase family)